MFIHPCQVTDLTGKPKRTSNGRLLAVIYPDQTGLSYSYDGMGNLTAVQPASYTSGSYTAQTNSASVGYSYDALNRLSQIQTESTSYTLTYDVFGNTTQIKAGANTLASYSYNENNGKLSILTYGNGLKVKYLYDVLDRISEICYNTGSGGTYKTVYSYQYTADGQLASIKDHTTNRITVYSYDPSGKLIGSYEYLENENLARYHANYAYDDLSRLTHVYQTVNYKVGTTASYEEEIEERYVYDGRGRLTGAYSTLGDFDVGTVLQYDDFDRITSKGYVISVEPSEDYLVSGYYTYAALTGRGTTAQVETYTSMVEDPDWNIIDETVYRFTYDENGNITEIRDASNAVIAQYTYDSLGQLTQEINVPLNRKFVWTYDDAGNILSKKTYNHTSGALIGTQNYTYSTGSWGDLLTQVGNTSIQYDSIGNPTMWGEESNDIWYDGAILTWQGRELESYQTFREYDDGYIDADYAVYFTYNDEGIRTEKDWDGYNHEYILNDSQIVGEWINNRSILILYIYDESGTPIGMKIRNSSQAEGVFDEYFFEKNIQGDIVAIYNLDGEKIGSYTYDAWGNFSVTLATTNTTLENEVVNTYNPYRYRGYYYDVETGLYYLQSRYYNPQWGRFISSDSVISGVGGPLQGNNVFVYSFNNPINMIDLFGNWPKWIENLINWFDNNICQPVANFIEDIKEDIRNYDSNNQSEEVVFKSNYFSCYKGVLVIKTPFDTSFSFGFIGLSTRQQNSNTLKHEFGHVIQMNNMGAAVYLANVAIPSVTINFLDRMGNLPYDYYTYPWEAEANSFGGATFPLKKPALPQGGYTSYWDLLPLFFE